MKTWTIDNDNATAVVSADDCRQAIHQLEVIGIVGVKNEDLVPLPTHHRYARALGMGDGWTGNKVNAADLKEIGFEQSGFGEYVLGECRVTNTGNKWAFYFCNSTPIVDDIKSIEHLRMILIALELVQ